MGIQELMTGAKMAFTALGVLALIYFMARRWRSVE
jgi:hypothetical protein